MPIRWPSELTLTRGFAYAPATLLSPQSNKGYRYPNLSLHRMHTGAGISTCCPSRTPFGLRLGPDFLRADEPSPENLRLSTAEFLAPLSLLMPAFSLLYNPPLLPVRLLLVYIAPLPIPYGIPKLRCQVLAPLIFGATSLDQ